MSSQTLVARWDCKACDSRGEIRWSAGTASDVLVEKIRGAHKARSPECESTALVMDAPKGNVACDMYIKFKRPAQVMKEAVA
jgi:hypothetical protein